MTDTDNREFARGVAASFKKQKAMSRPAGAGHNPTLAVIVQLSGFRTLAPGCVAGFDSMEISTGEPNGQSGSLYCPVRDLRQSHLDSAAFECV